MNVFEMQFTGASGLNGYFSMWLLAIHRSPLRLLTQGKKQEVGTNFLGANFEYFRVLEARGDKKIRTVQALF